MSSEDPNPYEAPHQVATHPAHDGANQAPKRPRLYVRLVASVAAGFAAIPVILIAMFAWVRLPRLVPVEIGGVLTFLAIVATAWVVRRTIEQHWNGT